jgi:hypothetical protein
VLAGGCCGVASGSFELFVVVYLLEVVSQLLVVMGYVVAVVVGASDCCGVAVGCDGLSGGCCCVEDSYSLWCSCWLLWQLLWKEVQAVVARS